MTGKRLSENERESIRTKYATGDFTYAQLAEEFQVSIPTIGNILRQSKVETAEEVEADSDGKRDVIADSIMNIKTRILFNEKENEKLWQAVRTLEKTQRGE